MQNPICGAEIIKAIEIAREVVAGAPATHEQTMLVCQVLLAGIDEGMQLAASGVDVDDVPGVRRVVADIPEDYRRLALAMLTVDQLQRAVADPGVHELAKADARAELARRGVQ